MVRVWRARNVKTRDGGLYREIYDDGKPSIIKQEIVKVFKDMVFVKSRKGKEYPVILSDKVRMNCNVQVGDVAVIKTFKKKWVVVDVICIVDDEEIGDDDLERQLEHFRSLGGDY